MSNKIVCFQTNYGDFKAEMFEDKAPLTTENFLSLVA